MLSKYTIMHNKTNLEKKWEKNAKKLSGRGSPLGGWGVGSKEPTRNDYFYYYWLQYQQTKLCTLVLVIWDPKAYNKLVTS